MENWKEKKILVVEDELMNYLFIQELLEETEIQVTHAKNGKVGVELFNSEIFDIIFMDIKMPVMDGFQATAEIRKINKSVVIIAQTAYASKREECLESGFTDYISKPFTQENLIRLLFKYINY